MLFCTSDSTVLVGYASVLLIREGGMIREGVSDWLILKRGNADLWPGKYSQFYIFYTTVHNPYIGECIK